MKNAMILWAVSSCAAMSLAVACSSSSSSAPVTPATDASTEDATASEDSGGSSSGGGSDSAPAAAQCLTTSTCGTGMVCCGSAAMTTACQVGPCPSIPTVGPVQLCTTAAECSSGQACITFPLVSAIKYCVTPDGGTSSEAGTDSGATEEAGPTEAGPDAADGG